jgi:hypothetical protein
VTAPSGSSIDLPVVGLGYGGLSRASMINVGRGRLLILGVI